MNNQLMNKYTIVEILFKTKWIISFMWYIQSKFNFSIGIVSSVGCNCSVFKTSCVSVDWLLNVQSFDEWVW